MMDKFSWGTNGLYGPDTLVAHFKGEDESIYDFADCARDLGCTVVVNQVVRRTGLTVFVLGVDREKLKSIISNLHSKKQKE